ncbi:MAG: ABC transporter permease [Planctomycetota bacterium]
MTIGVIAVAIYVTIGIALGSLAGYFGGRVDILVSRFIEVMISFPLIFLILTIVAVFDTRTIFLVMAAIGVTAWPSVARLVRGEFLVQRNLEYVLAAEALGIPRRRIIFRHVLPNALTPVLVAATFGIASAILTESTISFLGLGDPNAASWGMLLNQGRQSNLEWLILAPGAAIFFTVTVFNLLGEGLRDALDPRLRV